MKYSFYTLLLVIGVVFFLLPSELEAQNPPFASVNTDPSLAGGQFTFTTDFATIGIIGTDCNSFLDTCMDDLDLYWFVEPVEECSGCALPTTIVASGVVNDVFWSTNCANDGSANMADCDNPGGCNQTFTVPQGQLCPGATYRVTTYVFNPNHLGGVMGYECCGGSTPPSADLIGMDAACTTFSNGGSGAGWFNPSYPQSYEFQVPSNVNPPLLNITSNISNGGTYPCGYEFETTFSVVTPSSCSATSYDYRIFVNGVQVDSGLSNCTSVSPQISYTGLAIGCPSDPGCTPGLGQFYAECGVNTIRWEAAQACTDAIAEFTEIIFTLDCADVGALEIPLLDQLLCPDESGTVSVADPSVVDIPYPGGSYELHWDNPDPYANPLTNHIGTGQTATITNDGTYPYNTPVTIIGSVWENFSFSGPDGCEVYSETAEFIMLEPITAEPANVPCSFNSFGVVAAGGFPGYDNSGSYTYDASAAGAGTNTTGLFTSTTTGDPIPAGVYDILVTDNQGCMGTVEAEVYDVITVEAETNECSSDGDLDVTVMGGQPGHPNYNDYTSYFVISNLDGFLGNPDVAGNFSTTGLSIGTHTLTLSYNHIDSNGQATNETCFVQVEIVISDGISGEQQIDCSSNIVSVTAEGGYAGVTPGVDYTFELYADNPPTGGVLQTNTTGYFTGVDGGVYTVVINDNNPNTDPPNSCSVELMVEAFDELNIDFTSDPCSANNTITVDGLSGGLDPAIFTGNSYSLILSTDGSATPAPGTTAITTSNPVGDAPFSFIGLNAGTDYYIVLQDDRIDPGTGANCSTVIGPISLSEPPEIEITAVTCADTNTIGAELLGGTAPYDYYVYNLGSPLQGAPPAYNAATALAGAIAGQQGVSTGAFTAIPAGSYTVYGVDANGCPESSIDTEVFDPFDITLSVNPCGDVNLVDIESIVGGRDPNNMVNGGFAGSSYTIFLSTVDHLSGAVAPGDVLTTAGAAVGSINAGDVDSAPNTPEFTDVAAGSYFVVVEDDRGCQYSVPVTIVEAQTLSLDNTDCDAYGGVNVVATGGLADWTFYAYPVGAPYQAGGVGAVAVDAGDGSGADFTGAFSGLTAGDYTIYGVDANNCPPSSVDASVYEELTASFEYNCDYNTLTAEGEGGQSAVDNLASYTYELTNLDGTTVTDLNGSTVAPIVANNASGPVTFTDIPGGQYNLVLTEGDCSITIEVEVFDPLELTLGGCVFSSITASASGGYGTYNYTLLDDTGATVTSNTTGSFNGLDTGDYTVEVSDGNPGGPCIISEDQSIYDYEIVADPCDYNNFTVNIIGTTDLTGINIVAVLDGNNTSSPDGVFTDMPAGTYIVNISTDALCFINEQVTVYDPIELTDYDCVNGGGATGGDGDYFYILYDSNGILISSNTTGAFPFVSNGNYTVIVRDGNLCFITEEVECFNCDLTANASTNCIDGENYEVIVELIGTSTYIISDGVNTDITGAVAGNITVGPIPNGTYSIVITDEADETCTFTLEGEKDCFSCDLSAVTATECIDIDTYNVNITLTGTGTFTIEDGVNAIQTGVSAGTVVTGPFPNGSYSIIVTSENDDTCTETLTGSNDCFECELSVSEVVSCIDSDSFSVEVTISGNGTYSLVDGVNSPLSSAPSGSYLFGPYPNDTNYSIVVTSEIDPGCIQTVVGTENCFECDLDANITSSCIDNSTYELSFVLLGSGTYNINNGLTTLTNQPSGLYTFGPYDNGPYSIVVTSTSDSECSEIYTGSENCFECDLDVNAITNCIDNDTYSLSITLSGSGTYSIDDGGGTPITGAGTGLYPMGNYNSGSPYNITVTSEDDPNCFEVLSDEEVCFECDLTASATVECVDLENYDVTVTIGGTGSYTVNAGAVSQTGVSAGIYTYSFPNGAYAITITDETEDTCTETLTGNEDCFECDLAISTIEECFDLNTYNVSLTISGSGTFIVDNGLNVLTTISAGTYTYGPFNNGDYTIVVTSETDDTCVETINGTRDCFECDLGASAITECVDGDTYNVVVTITGSDSYSLDNGIDPLETALSAGTYTYGPFNNGDYTIVITSETDDTCLETLTGTEDCFECDLAATATPECVNGESYNVSVNITGSGTYSLDNGIGALQTGLSAGTYTYGPFSGDYTIVITDETEATCTETLTGTEDCFECDLVVNALPICQGTTEFNLLVTITGTGTFTIEDGNNPAQTGISAGQVTIGPYPNGTYSITVTSEIDDTCVEVVSGERDCFECDLAANPTTSCIDLETYEVSTIITGTGSFSIEDGLNPIQTGAIGGLYNFGPYPNGPYSITITSEEDPDCVLVLDGVEDCFECDLIVNGTPECIDLDSYNVNLTITGTGTFTVDDGGTIQTGITAGSLSMGPYPNGSYNIVVTSEVDDTCVETVSGEQDCFECDLSFEATPECIDINNFNVNVTINGSGTFSVNDGSTSQTGVSAGTYTYGPYPNGTYNIIITSEEDDTCTETINGEQDCFECDLSASATPVCLDLDSYNLTVNITGSGTFSVNDGSTTQTGISAGSLTLGPYPNGPYSITITSEEDDTCIETISGEQDCFDCDLGVSATPVCLDLDSYNLTVNITGSGTFSVNDGSTTQTGISAGSLTLGPYPNGSYSITVTSEEDDTCNETLSGEQDCFECDLSASATPVCLDLDSYNLTVNITGSGTFSVNDGSTTQTGISAGSLTLGPYPNGLYSITVTSEEDDTCIETLSGEQDCFECDLSASATPVCLDLDSYNLTVNITGSGTFTINDGSTTQTGISAGTLSMGPYPNGSYSITVTSEQDDTCVETVSGEQDCFECDLSASATAECIDNETYNLSLVINGSGSYTVADGINSPQTGITASTLTLGPYDNGSTTVVITSEEDSECSETLTVDEDCFECDLTVGGTPECQDPGQYVVNVSIGGSGTYSISDGIGPLQTGVTAGNLTMGPYPNGGYSIVVTNEDYPDCTETISGEEDCFECDLVVSSVPECIDDFTYNVQVTISASADLGDFTIDDGSNPAQTGLSSGTYTIGPISNGSYSINVFSELYPEDCSDVVSGEQDCLTCDLAAGIVVNCEDINNYTLDLTITGSSTYILIDGSNPNQTGLSAGTYSLGPYPNGAYSIMVIDEFNEDCSETLNGEEDCFECPLEASFTPSCVENETYVNLQVDGEGLTYSIDDGLGGVQTITIGNGESFDFGPYPDGSFNITITNDENPDCQFTASGTEVCCDLEANATTECIDDGNISVSLNISGSGTFTVDDGSSIQTGISAGTLDLGTYEEGAYAIVITSENNEGCTTTVNIEEECECDLGVNIVAECLGQQSYLLNVTLNGSSTYEINDGINPVFVNQTGSIQLGPYFTPIYNIVVTSETDSDCTETVSGEQDCFECDLTWDATPVCNDFETFNVEVDLNGFGTFTINDGNTVQTGVSAGPITMGPYPNGGYSIIITSEEDENCVETISGDFDCFECVLEAAAVTECEGTETFTVLVQVNGPGTYTLSDGINTDLTNQSSGVISMGPYFNGNYSIDVISEVNEECTVNVSGEEDCFECDLEATATPVCNEDGEGYFLDVIITGTGTFTISSDGGVIIGAQTAGTIQVGPFENGDYSLEVISDLDNECIVELNGFQDCFDCELDVSVSTECNDFNGYNLIVQISGNGTYQLNDGVNPILTAQSAGTITLGPVPNGSYNLTVISEIDPSCEQVVTGTEDCFECELPGAASTICVDEETYNVLFTLDGPGTYTIDDGIGSPQSGQAPGNYIIGPIPNGGYNIEIISDEDSDCTTVLTGINDCSEDETCNISISAEPTCINEDEYNVALSLVGGGTYTIADGINPPLTAQTAGVIIVGPIADGPYSITVTSEDLEDCEATISGTKECTPDFICDLSFTTETECINVDSFSATINLSGTGTYTINDGTNPALTGQSAGSISLGPLANGTHTIIVTSEIDPECTLSVPVQNDCTEEFSCDLIIDTVVECEDISGGGFNVIVTITGSNTYNVVDNTIGFSQSGVTAGTITLGPYPDGSYNVTVTNEGNPICFQSTSGNKFCNPVDECDLSIDLETSCDGDELDLVLVIEGSSTYTVFANLTTLTGVTAGSYDIEGSGFFFDYNITVIDENEGFFECQQTISGSQSCPDCELDVVVEPDCIDGEASFMVDVTVNGNSTYQISDAPGNILLDNIVPPTTVTVGPFDDGFYNITVADENIDGCFENFFATQECDPVECDLEVDLDVLCMEGDSLLLVMTVEGSNTYNINYTIQQSDFGSFDNVGAGTYEIGPFDDFPEPGPYDYEIQITETSGFFFDCFVNLQGTWECAFCGELNLSTDIECINQDEYLVYLTIDGEGSYDIFGPNNVLLENSVEGGVYEFGPYSEDSFFPFDDPFFYYFNVVDEAGAQFCFQDVFGVAECEVDVECDLNASIDFDCYDDGETYDIVLTIEGSDTYTINNGINTLNGQNAGEYTFGPYSNGIYSIDVLNEVNGDCNQSFSGAQFCEPPPNCDLVTTATPVCIDDFSFNLEVAISGSGTFTLDDGVNTPITGLTAGTYNIGPLNNGPYNAEVFNEANTLCRQEFAGNYDCDIDIPCDLSLNIVTECIENEAFYNVIVEIDGSSTYTITVDGFDDIDNAVTGSYTFGPIPNGFYNVVVQDEDNDECNQSSFGNNECDFIPLNCDLEADLTFDCTEGEESFYINFEVSGSSVYTLHEGLYGGGAPFGDVVQAGITAGTYTVGPYPVGGVSLVMVDDFNVVCFADFIVVRDCDCDLEFDIDYECLEDESYIVTVDLNGSDNYDITLDEFGGDGDEELLGVEAGVYEFGPLTNDQFYLTINSDEEACFQDYLGVRDCSENGECDLEAEIINIYCDDNGAVLIDVNISGSNEYLIQVGPLPPDTAVPPGIHTVGPFPDQFNYSFTIRDVDNGSCAQNFFGNFECEGSGGECDLDASFGAPQCSEDNTGYFIDVTISGSGVYDIDTGPGVSDLSGLVTGTYQTGPYPNGAYNITVSQQGATTPCSESTSGTFLCAPPSGCDLSVTILDIECSGLQFFDLYSVDLSISGSGIYTIYIEDDVITGQTAGVVTLGPYTAGTSYNIIVEDASDPECFRQISAVNPCSDEVECNLLVQSSVDCLEDGSFNVIINITGDDSYLVEVDVEGNEPITLFSLTEGEHEIGPFISGNDPPYVYDVVVSSQDNSDCFFITTGSSDCNPPPPLCDLSIEILDIACSGLNFFDLYEITLEITGTGTYSVITDEETITGQTAGVITIGPYPASDFYTLRVEDENLEECFQFIEAPNPCVDDLDCDLVVSTVTVSCNPDGTSYNLVLNISGSDTYTVFGNAGGEIINFLGQSPGDLTLGPFTVEGAFELQVTSDFDSDCFSTTSGNATCPDPPICDVGFDIVSYSCEFTDDGPFYTMDIQISGSSFYDVINETGTILTGQAAGLVTIGPFPAENQYTITVQEDADCSQTQEGANNCIEPPSCDISGDADPICNEGEETYNVEVTIGGSSTYSVTITAGAESETQSGLSAGNITMGPFDNTNSNYSVTITDETDADCFAGFSGSANCGTPPVCELNTSVVELICEDETYSVEIEITGNDIYNIYLDGEIQVNDVDPGTIVVGAIPLANTTYTILVESVNILNCSEELSGTNTCAVPECDIVANVSDNCIDDEQTVVVEITTTGDYTIELTSDTSTDNFDVSGGDTYEYIVTDSENYSVTITDNTIDNCFYQNSGTFECVEPPVCELDASVVELICGDASYWIEIEITGNDIYNIYDGAGDLLLSDQDPGVIELGPFFVLDEEYSFLIESVNIPDCSESLSGTNTCSVIDCDLVADITDNCDGAVQTVSIEITSTGDYTIELVTDTSTDTFDVSGGDTYEYIVANDSDNYFVTITDNAIDNCFFQNNGSFECEEPPVCDLAVDIIEFTCDEIDGEQVYFIDIELEGSGTFTIESESGEELTNQTAGIIQVGPYPSTNFYSITVTSDAIGDCTETLNGTNTCANPDCDLIMNASSACTDDGVVITVDISGSSNYTINISSNAGFDSFTEVGAGSYEFGPYEEEIINYDITAFDEEQFACLQTTEGTADCSVIEPPGCNLDMDIISSFCEFTTDGPVYTFAIEISGSGSYTLSNEGGEIESDVSAGIYTYGPFPAEDTFSITVDGGAGCLQQQSGSNSCSDVNCDLDTDVEVNCISEDSFSLLLEINGDNQYNVFASFEGQIIELTDQVEGTMEIGPFDGGEGDYEILVVDQANLSCFLTNTGTVDCSEPPVDFCNLFGSAEANCIDELTYEITLTITGSGTYNIFTGVEDLFGQPAGVLVLGPFSDTDYEVYIQKTTDPDCVQTITGSKQCGEPFLCNLLSTATVDCITEESYNLVVDISGTGTFSVNAGFDQTLEMVPAGEYVLGPFSNTNYSVSVQSDVDEACFQQISGVSQCSDGGGCDLNIEVSANCVDDGIFDVVIDIEGNSSYSIFSSLLPNAIEGEFEGQVIIENVSGSSYDVFVQDELDEECFAGYNGNINCEIPPNCNLNAELQNVLCINSELYVIQLALEGQGTYTITNFGQEVVDDATAGIIELGPFASGPFDLLITSNSIENCFQSFSDFALCDEEPTCDLAVGATTSCFDEDSFEVTIDIQGTDTYEVDLGIGDPPVPGIEAGEVTLGPFPNGPYVITITSEQDPTCQTTVTGIKDCENLPNCDLNLDGEVICVDEDGFNVIVEIEGSSSYILFDGINPPVANQTAGTVTLGPIPNGSYEITVYDEGDSECFQTITGINNCANPPACEVDASYEAVCADDGSSYNLEISLVGFGAFTIDDGVNPPITGAFSDDYVLGPFTDPDYQVSITSELADDCVRILSGSVDCETDCNISVQSEIIELSLTEFYVGLTITGEGDFTIDDQVNTPQTGQGAGFVLAGPFIVGAYEIIITSEDIDDCSTIVDGFFEGEFDLGSIGDIVFEDDDKDGIQDADEPGLPNIEVTLYTTDDELVEVTTTDSDGSYLFPNLPPGTYYIVFELPEDYSASPQDIGPDESIDSDIQENGQTMTITLNEGQDLGDIDAGMYPNIECNFIGGNYSIVCYATDYFVGIAIDGGTSPFYIDAGEYFQGTIAEEDFPIPFIGPIPQTDEPTVFITDANGCPVGPFLLDSDCVTVSIELLEFTGQVEEAGNHLFWITTSEINNDYFTLMRSTDGIHFEAIAEVDGAGDSNMPINYDFLDKDAPQGVSYYQLEQTDNDGTSTLSNIVELFRGSPTFGELSVMPIPARDQITVSYQSAIGEEVILQIHDAAGRLLHENGVSVIDGTNQWNIDINAYPVGAYILSLQNGIERQSIKFIKEQ